MNVLGIFIANPLAALLVALLFARLAITKRTLASWICTGSWALYTIYEHLMQTRVLCSGECNIRVDLLAIYPALLAVSVWAIVQSFRKKPEVADTDDEQENPHS